MNIGFLDVLVNVAVLLALAVPGFICRKAKLFGEGSVGTMSVILMYVCAPFLTITSFQGTPYSREILFNMLWTVLFSFVIQVLVYFIMLLVFRRSERPRAEKGVYTYACTFCNCGYMGIPLLVLLGLSEAVIYAAVFIAVFNILSWTLGVFAISGKREYISLKKAILNPPTVALAVAIPLFCLGIRIADFSAPLYSGIEMLGNMTTPVAMIMLGVRLAEMSPREILGDKNSYLFSAVRLVVAPLLMFAILLFLPLSPTLKTALFLIAAMPSASASVAFAEKFGGDTFIAAKMLLVTSVLSVLTIPLLSLLLQFF